MANVCNKQFNLTEVCCGHLCLYLFIILRNVGLFNMAPFVNAGKYKHLICALNTLTYHSSSFIINKITEHVN